MILVVGDVMTDVIVRPHAAPAHGTDCPAAIQTRPGGSGANVACWIAALGGQAAFAGRVGRAEAAAHHSAFQEHGVRAHLAVDDDRPTGRVVAIVAADGERSFYTDRGANLALHAGDLPPALLDGVQALHVSGHTLCAAGPREAALALIASARERGRRISVDAGSIAWLATVGRDAFLHWTRPAALCFANGPEAAFLAATDADFAERVVTRGHAGIEAWRGRQHASLPAPRVENPETTGAGDAAVAGFLLAHCAGSDLPGCLAAAVAAADQAVRSVGARPPASCNGHATVP